jgi:hypothetical protein
MSEQAVEPIVTQYLTSQFYHHMPVAWDGEDQFLYTSFTNNCRYYGVTINAQAEMAFESNMGFTTTPTSNNPYPTKLPFVYPGIVPTFQYDSSTAKYSVVILGVEGTTITKLSSTQFPSQNFSSGGFLRIMLGFNDDPVLHFYGNASSTRTCWTATVDPSGQLSAITQVGGTFTIAGNPYLDGMTVPFSDRFAFMPNHWLAFDRLNPKVVFDLKPKLAASAGMMAAADRYYAEHVYNPNRLVVVRKASYASDAASVIVDVQVAEDGSTLTIVNTWSVPAPSPTQAAYATMLPDGKVVAVVASAVGDIVHYDIFGSPQNLGAIGSGAATRDGIAPFDIGFTVFGRTSYNAEHNLMALPAPVIVADPLTTSRRFGRRKA